MSSDEIRGQLGELLVDQELDRAEIRQLQGLVRQRQKAINDLVARLAAAGTVQDDEAAVPPADRAGGAP